MNITEKLDSLTNKLVEYINEPKRAQIVQNKLNVLPRENVDFSITISPSAAKLAKEKGFPQGAFKCFWYNTKGILNGNSMVLIDGVETYVSYAAPTQEQLSTWLRKKGLTPYAQRSGLALHSVNNTVYPKLDSTEGALNVAQSRADSWEEAIEFSIIEALKNLENNKK